MTNTSTPRERGYSQLFEMRDGCVERSNYFYNIPL